MSLIKILLLLFVLLYLKLYTLETLSISPSTQKHSLLQMYHEKVKKKNSFQMR